MDHLDGFLPVMCLPPEDERRFSYTYLGQHLVGFGQAKDGRPQGVTREPLYLFDGLRTRPFWMLGEDSNAKRHLMLSLAAHDMACGRSVIFIDGDGDRSILDGLHYWCGRKLNRPVQALMPLGWMDELSGSWNPFASRTLTPSAVAEAIFSAYEEGLDEDMGMTKKDRDRQREGLSLLLKTLHEAGKSCSAWDVVNWLEEDEEAQKLGETLKTENKALEEYGEWMDVRGKENWPNQLDIFLEFLELLDHWTLGSYRPSIRLNEWIRGNRALYVGVPSQVDSVGAMAVGKTLLHQLRTLISHMEAKDRTGRRMVSIFFNGTNEILAGELADWLMKLRASELMVTCSFSTKGDLDKIHPKLAGSLMDDSPLLAGFQTRDSATADWLAEKWSRTEPTLTDSSGTIPTEPGIRKGLWSEKIQNLPEGRCVLHIPVCAESVMVLQTVELPSLPERADFRYHRARAA